MEINMSVIDGISVYQKTLSCGRIEVSSEVTDYPLTDLFDIAERRNPKRAFLFVSKVLGRHIPVSPQVMRNVYTQLAEQFRDSGRAGGLYRDGRDGCRPWGGSV
jgi:NADH:ubiquinone oxidoreductase subunit B-like Fe-S oxidoreductase